MFKTIAIVFVFIFISVFSSGQKHLEFRGDTNYFLLKNNDTLLTIDSDNDTVSSQVFFKHGKTIKKLPPDFQWFVWPEMDDDKYFMIGSAARGSPAGENFFIFKKSNYSLVYSSSGFIIYKDTVRSIVIFDDIYKHNGYFTVLNVTNNTREFYKEPTDIEKTIPLDWELEDLSNDSFVIGYRDTAQKKKIIVFQRRIRK